MIADDTLSLGGPAALAVAVRDQNQVGDARRTAVALGDAQGMNEQERSTLALVVTEAATNLARHAKRGVILLRDTSALGHAGVEVLAVDCGPGMHDLERHFADGFSTGGTSGAGLGAMRRQADQLDVYSVPGQGTVVLARVFAADSKTAASHLMEMGVVCLPLDGETVCGDGWCIRQDADRAMVLIVDGLGHGPNAAQAADTALDVFRATEDRTAKETVSIIHDALRATRGAAVAVAEIRRTPEGASVALCGVGNTVTAVIGAAGPRSLPSMNGTAGLSIRALQSFTQTLRADDLLVMHTDGLTTRWRLDAYPRVREHDPAIASALLHRDASRGRDDATVLALRLRPSAS
jgi:anti-sigma regulatory factor (Ser/Thr protein kinase)